MDCSSVDARRALVRLALTDLRFYVQDRLTDVSSSAVRFCALLPRVAAMPSDSPVLLLVADNPPFLRACAHVLRAARYRVITAHDGASALDAVRDSSTTVDLLIVDMGLPDMSGADLVQRIACPAPVLFMSGHATPASRALRKPFTAMDLLLRVGELVGSASPATPMRPAE